jgi:ligand-binding sensor domain-containing protein
LPSNRAIYVTIDGSGNKWIGTSDGLAKFDGTNWTVYNIYNSGLPGYGQVLSLAIDGSGNKWIGTWAGLAKFNGTNWTVYNTSNSGLPDDGVLSIAIDGSGNKWIGTNEGGLAVYNEGGIVTDVESGNNYFIFNSKYIYGVTKNL